MVTDKEREELGRLTHQKIQALSRQQQERDEQAGIKPGRMTLQNLQCMKSVQKQSETRQARVKLLIERLKLAITTTISGFFNPSQKRVKESHCKVYGHNLPWGSTWEGEFPRCHDCGEKITDPNQLRGAAPMEDRRKFKSFGEF